MITEYRLHNYKSHKDTKLKLNNLTILTGLNGCGKSSIIQGLLLLRQTYQNKQLGDGLNLNGDLCCIGVADDALSRISENGNIGFDLVIDNSKSLNYLFTVKEGAEKSSFIIKKEYSEGADDEKYLSEISLFNKNFQYISTSRIGGKSDFRKDTYKVEWMQQLSSKYGDGGLVAEYLDKFGNEECIDYVQAGEDDLSLLNQVVFWERKFSPDLTIEVHEGTDPNYITIKYGFEGDDKGTKPIRNLNATNVGYGISYTLPVIVALISAKPGALVIIENPEAHLHPKGQAELAKLIAMVSHHGIQVIVETHSDHIISGIQLACKAYSMDESEGISNEEVCVYYLGGRAHHESIIENVKIQPNGVIDHQPRGFFDQAEFDMYELYD